MAKAKTKSKKLRDQATELADRVAPHVEHARQKAAPYVAEARKTAGPALTDARDKLTTEVLPVLTAAIAAANEATEEVREEAVKRGKATAAALKGEVAAPKKKHRLRRLLVALGLSGVVAMIAKKLSDRQATTAWQSSYTPTPAPTSTTSGGTAGTSTAGTSGIHKAEPTDDVGGASPDVAAADAAAEPGTPTTPDNPLQQDDINKAD